MERRLNLHAFPTMALFALCAGCGGGSSPSATMPPPPTDPGAAVVALKTATPIKHVIIIVGENRGFDHIFATYVPKTAGESVLNLLSQRIVNADGTPGPNFAQAYQYRITSAPNGGKYFSSADLKDKNLYATLPPPDVGDVPAVSSDANILNIPGGDPELPPEDQYLFGTGGTGLSFTLGPDTRISNVMTLPPGPFQLTGPHMPFDAFTADTIHQFFQMWQQVDCAVDAEHISASNPTGCLHDLQSAVTTTYDTPPGSTPHDTGQTMAFFNMQQGDAPLFKSLADEYTISDNYHQPVMGGTGPDSMPLAFADQIFYSDGAGHVATPPAIDIFNPDPQPGTLNLYSRSAAVGELLGPDSAWRGADSRLPEGAALCRGSALRARAVLAGGQYPSGADAQGRGHRGAHDAADDAKEHRRPAGRAQHPLEVLRRRLRRRGHGRPV